MIYNILGVVIWHDLRRDLVELIFLTLKLYLTTFLLIKVGYFRERTLNDLGSDIVRSETINSSSRSSSKDHSIRFSELARGSDHIALLVGVPCGSSTSIYVSRHECQYH